jgi:hypothetical protein
MTRQQRRSRHRYHRKTGEWPDQPIRVADATAEDREEGRVIRRPHVAEISLAQGASQCEHVRAVVLHPAQLEIREGVPTGVVVSGSINKREVETGETCLFEDSEVGVLWAGLVHRGEGGVTDWMKSRGGVQPDELGISWCGLEQHGGSSITGRFPVQYNVGLMSVPLGSNESGRAEQARFLAVGEQYDDVVA